MNEELLQENVDFKFYALDDAVNSAAIKILNGIFEDVSYMYGSVNIDEDKENDQCYLIFDYEILDPASHNEESLTNDANFKDHIGNVLKSIISNSLAKEKEIYEFGTVDIEESNKQ